MKKIFFPLVISALVISACENEEPEGSLYGSGIYIINEGFFMQNNGSVSYFDPGQGKLVNNIFEMANSRPTGDIVQSAGIYGDSVAYIIVNGLSKVEVVRLSDFRSIAAPFEIDYPRYFIRASSSKGYISSGSMKGNLIVIDLEKHSVTDTIAAGYGPEMMTASGNLVYVCNSGGFYKDSTVMVVNTLTDHVTDTLYTGMCPADIKVDNGGNLWAYCRGYVQYDDTYTTIINETDAVIQKIDPQDGAVIWQGIVGKAGDYTTVFPKMAFSEDRNDIYYLRPDGVYHLSAANPLVTASPVITGSYYGIFIHPENGDIYLFEASLSGNGTMHIFGSDLQKISEYTTGIMPNGAVYVP